MNIRVKLLLLVVFLGLALLVNLLALGYLVHSISTALRTIEEGGINQQLVAVQMQAHLRDAQAALYSYIIEADAAFASQFREQLQGFEADAATYQSQPLTEQEQAWAKVLVSTHQQATQFGQEIIQLRDKQTEHLAQLEAAQTTISDLLNRQTKTTNNVPYQTALTGMQNSLGEILLAITTYLALPKQAESAHFGQAVIAFKQHFVDFKALANSPADQALVQQIEPLFSQIEVLGLRLIFERDQQQASFSNFAVIVFRAGQELLVGKIQPQATRNLTVARQQLQLALNFAITASLLFAVLVSILAGAITWPLVRQLNSGILALLQGAERVANGNLSQPVPLTGQDELSQLATGFNAMMKDLAIHESDLQARLSELEALRQVSLQLTRTLDPTHVLKVIVTSALTLTAAMEVHIFTKANEFDALEFAASVWRDPERHGRLRPLRPDGITATAARTGQPQIIPHATTHPLFNTLDMQPWGIRAAASWPLKLSERVLGVLNVSFDNRDTIGEDILRLLGLLADQAAIALENARLYQSLTDREARLETMAHKLAHVQEEERRLIGLDLHDGLTQLLLGANMHLNTLTACASQWDSQAVAELDLARLCLQDAIGEARHVVSELRPMALEDYGLVEGLRYYVSEMSQRQRWQMEFNAPSHEVKLEPAIETAVFRIAQEAVNNSRKHAVTQRIRVALQFSESELELQVQDWGRGFELADIPTESLHLGLVGMHERAALLNGECQVTSQRGEGTKVWARIPY